MLHLAALNLIPHFEPQFSSKCVHGTNKGVEVFPRQINAGIISIKNIIKHI